LQYQQHERERRSQDELESQSKGQVITSTRSKRISNIKLQNATALCYVVVVMAVANSMLEVLHFVLRYLGVNHPHIYLPN
jgi:hypothetical protein